MNHTTRRRFLRSVAVAAGPCIAVGRLHAAEQTAPPSERITIGVLGCGTRGAYVARALSTRGAQVVAVCDCHRQKRERLAQLYRCDAFADFRDVLARGDVDAVLVATPEHWHAAMVIEACRQGKDIFCEKPLSHTIAEAQAMVAAVARYGRILQVGTQQRSDARYRLACELVRNGRIGEVQEVWVDPGFASRGCDLPAEPPPPELDWNLWLGPAPWAPYHPGRCENRFAWWQWDDYSGGQTTDHGAHDFDIVHWGLGMDGSGPVEIVPPDGERGELTLRYANGVLVHSGRQGWQQRWSLVTFKGSAGTVSVWRGGIETEPKELAGTRIGPDETLLHRSNDHAADFLRSVRTREPPVSDVISGASSVTVCHLANIVYRLGRRLRWDPARNEFLQDDEANRLRARSPRQPW